MLSRNLRRRSIRALSNMSLQAKKAAAQQPEWITPKPTYDKPVLKIYNSLTRTKNEFVTLKPNRITWYSCGPTVYDRSHMGHARNYVATDICRRILQDYFGYNIKFIQNVTDIDDKIIIAARQEYLFEQEIINKYQEVSDELLASSKKFLSEYITKNLPEFSGKDIETEFSKWAESLDVQSLSQNNPKFPMYLKAARNAFSVIYSKGSKVSIEEFTRQIRDVAVVSLDKELGHTVNDPSVFRKLPLYWEESYNDDMNKLNVLRPSVTTRVSEYIPEIVEYVDKIVQNGFAYATNDGSVYFDTVKFENDPRHDYAKLQPWNKGDLSLINDGEGSLSLDNTSKRNAADFALWKASKPGEPSWPSKWGEGRPGWHIECSVMASDIGGEVLDIHSGGVDLCFPHHDNELAQSEAYFDNKQWINYFMHNGHLHIQGQKMSKSLKNFITIEEALNDFSSRQLRLVFALTPWEKPLDFKDSLINEVKSLESYLSKFFTTVRALNNDQKLSSKKGVHFTKKPTKTEKQLYQDLENAQDETHIAFCDNLASYKVLKIIQDLVSKANQYIQLSLTDKHELRIEVLLEITHWITRILNILGFHARQDHLGWLDNTDSGSSSESREELVLPYVKALSQFRDKVRNLSINKAPAQDFLKETDNLRYSLINLGISLDDLPSGEALVKFLNKEEQKLLIEQYEAKEQALLEKERRKQEQNLKNQEKEKERIEKMKIKPSELFQNKELYSEWDEQGIPTKDAKGEEISKSMKKKLVKQFNQQEKLYQEYCNMQK
ncbi:Piso0_005635 [Millerozyma farinosa CBS 7064]|uniref:cysteine--tRNA ligase n=1 Tax=Pichia sorbitophila (strain ATCC MYA-4447 / BCRC 22081 / CBS 7064 / NBRC 10061 / NRRL Y-12695) TaxID=559304 RepID=G8XZI7_PICSO|nr:Piso0_005635 [Millerozyma farinosa CBS 7064]